MPAKATGSAFFSRGKWFAKVWLGKGKRPTFLLVGIVGDNAADKLEAKARAADLQDKASAMRAAGHTDDIALTLLRKMAEGAPGASDLIDRMCAGKVTAKRRSAMTIRQLGEAWTSGELHRRFPHHVKAKRTAAGDRGRLEAYVYPLLENLAVEAFTIEHGESVMSGIPADRATATCRHVAQLLSKLLNMAVYPLRLIPASPIPRGWMPTIGKGREADPLWPAEHDTLLAHTALPLCYRILCGFLAREGMRSSEAAALQWADLELSNGMVQLDENKTHDVRGWVLNPDVAAALRLWKKMRVGSSPYVFVDEAGRSLCRWVKLEGGAMKPVLRIKPEEYRRWLKAAGIERKALFNETDTRRPTRIHDLRGLFVTAALANGKTEVWTMDRTGHTTSNQLNRYRRRARSWAEAKMGDLSPLTRAIPELRVREAVSADVSATSDVQDAKNA